MINPHKRQFRWGPIPGRLISVSHWIAIYHYYPRRLHRYIWPESYLIFSQNNMLFISEMDRLEKVGEKVFQEIILTHQIKKFWKVWQKYLFNLFSFCKKFDKDYLKSLSNTELRKIWIEFNDLVHLFWEAGIIPELGAYGGEPILKKFLEGEKLDENKERNVFSLLSAPTGLSFYQEEEMDLLKLFKKHRAKKFDVLLQKHQQKYFWLENSYFHTKVLKKEFFLKRIREKIKNKIKPDEIIRKIYTNLATTKQKKVKILEKLKNRKKIKKISDGVCYCIWWQDQRKKYIFQYLHYLDLFLQEFARRAGISSKTFNFAWPEEVVANPSPKLINLLKKRARDYFVVYCAKNQKQCFCGQKAKKIYRTFWLRKMELVQDQFKGLVVHVVDKSVKGRVYLIRKSSEIKKFPQGRILVTSMTSPDYITAIKKAKAIVTDEGGITCHAAIVSRELGIPCIVGTKVATQILKDGQIVEVDTTKGVVRVIK